MSIRFSFSKTKYIEGLARYHGAFIPSKPKQKLKHPTLAPPFCSSPCKQALHSCHTHPGMRSLCHLCDELFQSRAQPPGVCSDSVSNSCCHITFLQQRTRQVGNGPAACIMMVATLPDDFPASGRPRALGVSTDRFKIFHEHWQPQLILQAAGSSISDTSSPWFWCTHRYIGGV